jgi:hypothetical protein
MQALLQKRLQACDQSALVREVVPRARIQGSWVLFRPTHGLCDMHRPPMSLGKTPRIRPTRGRGRAGAAVAVWRIYCEGLEMGLVPDATDGALGGSATSAARATEAMRASPLRLRG